MVVKDASINTMGLKGQLTELVKQAIFYDGEGRPERIKTVQTDAKDGTPCTEVVYEYFGAGSNRVIKMKERATDEDGVLITWDAANDIVGE
jgi:hypothetical protein